MKIDVAPLDRLYQIVKEEGNQKKAAKRLGITQGYLSDLVNARRDFSDSMLSKLGLRRTVVSK